MNVATEHQDPKSYLNLYWQLLPLRRMHPALSTGDYEPIAATEDLLAYIRHSQGKRLLIVINRGGESRVGGLDYLLKRSDIEDQAASKR